MHFELGMTCDGEAFESDPNAEVARILRQLADRIADATPADVWESAPVALRDVNGNTVGVAFFGEV